MVNLGILAKMEAKPGKEAAVEALLNSALSLANAESGTTVWFAMRLGAAEFWIFDAFADETARNAHLNGPIAAALMANASALLIEPPQIEKVKLIAAKLGN